MNFVTKQVVLCKFITLFLRQVLYAFQSSILEIIIHALHAIDSCRLKFNAYTFILMFCRIFHLFQYWRDQEMSHQQY